jgi:hypothetical protein
MLEPTVILAALSVIGHCLAIFWPRKPLQERLDENGFPILWCNNDDKQENIACVWRDVTEQPVTAPQDDGTHQRSA